MCLRALRLMGSGLDCDLAFPCRASVPSCSRPSRPSLRWPLKKRPALTAAARDGTWIERPGRENAPRGRTRECDGSERVRGCTLTHARAADDLNFRVPVPACCRGKGNGNWEVAVEEELMWSCLCGRRDHSPVRR